MAFFVAKVSNGRLSSTERDFEIIKSCSSFSLYYIKEIDSMLPCVCSVIDRRGRQNVVSKNISDFDGLLRQQRTVLFLALVNEL